MHPLFIIHFQMDKFGLKIFYDPSAHLIACREWELAAADLNYTCEEAG